MIKTYNTKLQARVQVGTLEKIKQQVQSVFSPGSTSDEVRALFSAQAFDSVCWFTDIPISFRSPRKLSIHIMNKILFTGSKYLKTTLFSYVPQDLLLLNRWRKNECLHGHLRL